jgi:hypothetical protein
VFLKFLAKVERVTSRVRGHRIRATNGNWHSTAHAAHHPTLLGQDVMECLQRLRAGATLWDMDGNSGSIHNPVACCPRRRDCASRSADGWGPEWRARVLPMGTGRTPCQGILRLSPKREARCRLQRMDSTARLPSCRILQTIAHEPFPSRTGRCCAPLLHQGKLC